jgi:hypothetical protein
MIELGVAPEDDVVLAFLRAEIDSPKWGPLYLRLLRDLHLDRGSLIDVADVADVRAGSIRKDILGAVRGYGRNDLLFTAFPRDTRWRRVRVELSDFYRLKCISNDERWFKLTGGTRLIQEAARNLDVDPQVAVKVRGTIQRIEQHLPLAELIMVETDAGELVLVEGHTRATAYAVLSDRAFLAFMGTSPLMDRWAFI